MLDVIYYNYYRFYRNVLKVGNPHELAALLLATSFGGPTCILVNALALKYYCYSIDILYLTSISIGFGALAYFVFLYLGKGRKIVENRPAYWRNQKLSAWLVALCALFFVLVFILAAIWNKVLYQACF
jgi:hypothetical protein